MSHVISCQSPLVGYDGTNGSIQPFLKVIRGGEKKTKLEMLANAQRDGRPAKHRWRPLFNATKFG